MFCYTMLAEKYYGKVYSDLTGKFPVQSFKVHLYIFVYYVYLANAILVFLTSDRTDAFMVETFKDIYEYLDTWELH